MVKDFDSWNNAKKETNAEAPRLYTVREIWWCRFGVNIGTEQDGKGTLFLRPVIILRGFGPEACLIVPLTTAQRDHPLRVPVGVVQGKVARANISQIKTIDTRRLVEKIGFVNKDVFAEIRKTARNLF